MIMNIVWKRVSDTGKNWRHVYKVRNCPGATKTLFIFRKHVKTLIIIH